VAIIAVLLLHEKRRHPKLGAYPKHGDFTLLRESQFFHYTFLSELAYSRLNNTQPYCNR
jgi:hypothetical protein